MGAAVEPDHAGGLTECAEQFVSEELLRDRIHFLPNPDVGRAPQRVGGRMGLGLVLPQGQDGRVPAIRLQARGIVDRQPGVVAERRPRDTMLLIFVIAPAPLAGQTRWASAGAAAQVSDDNDREEVSRHSGSASRPFVPACDGSPLQSYTDGQGERA
jgi:hypothetical protein